MPTRRRSKRFTSRCSPSRNRYKSQRTALICTSPQTQPKPQTLPKPQTPLIPQTLQTPLNSQTFSTSNNSPAKTQMMAAAPIVPSVPAVKNPNLPAAEALYKIYLNGYAFPKWVLNPYEWMRFRFSDTIVFYHSDESLTDVKLLMREREPCNINMRRFYKRPEMASTFGYEIGAYRKSTPQRLMPNVAVYCYASVRLKTEMINVHVINLVGYAFDSCDQPDAIYFATRDYSEVVARYHRMWILALMTVRYLNESKRIIYTIKIYNVGGGAFAPDTKTSFINKIFLPSFGPLLPDFSNLGVSVTGFDFKKNRFNGGFIPDIFEEGEDYTKTLYVNAWDPWSIIGNGNENDSSLDGYWGRSSNMSVLGWAVTNPYMKYVGITSIYNTQ